jgi:hypothetical protein
MEVKVKFIIKGNIPTMLKDNWTGQKNVSASWGYGSIIFSGSQMDYNKFVNDMMHSECKIIGEYDLDESNKVIKPELINIITGQIYIPF